MSNSEFCRLFLMEAGSILPSTSRLRSSLAVLKRRDAVETGYSKALFDSEARALIVLWRL